MTLTSLIQVIWRKYDKSVDYPTAGSDDYNLILGYINDAIQSWGDQAHEDNIKWRELFTNLSSASSGTKTTTNATASYVCPDDFVEMSSFLKITDATGNSLYYSYIDPDDVMANLKNDSSARIYWLTRNSTTGKWWVNISPTPTTTGDTIEYSYYKTPTELSTGTNIIEMGKPYFAVYHALTALFEEERPDLANVYSQKAVSVMNAMIIDNEVPPHNQSFKLRDIANEMTGDVFGK